MRCLIVLMCSMLPLMANAKPREVEDVVTLKGKKTNRWRGFHENGKRWYVHYWRGGKKVGTHRDFDAQGRPKSLVTYRRDILNGPFKTWHANGEVATQGQYRDGAEHGLREAFHADGKPSERRQFADTLPVGRYQAWHANGQLALEGLFETGMAVGTWTRRDAQGAVIETRIFDRGVRRALAYPVRRVGGDLDGAGFCLFLATGGHFEGFDFQVWIHPNGWVDLVRLQTVPRVAQTAKDGLRKGTFYYGRRALHSRLRLTDADWQALRDRLRALKPWSLPEKTINRDIADGSQWYFGIRANGRSHQALFDNAFTPEIKAFRAWLQGRLTSDTYAFDRLTARPDETRTWRRTFDFKP